MNYWDLTGELIRNEKLRFGLEISPQQRDELITLRAANSEASQIIKFRSKTMDRQRRLAAIPDNADFLPLVRVDYRLVVLNELEPTIKKRLLRILEPEQLANLRLFAMRDKFGDGYSAFHSKEVWKHCGITSMEGGVDALRKEKEKADKVTAKAGGNRFVWNMRHPGYKTFPGMVYYGSPNAGPKAVPGKYKVKLTVNGQSKEQEFEILKDPRVETTKEELQMQFDFLVKVRDKVSEANQGVIEIRKIKDDLGYVKNKIGTEPQYKDLNDAVKKFEDDLTVIENNIQQTKNKSLQDPLNYGIKLNNQLAFLMGEQGMGDFKPNKQAEEVRVDLAKKIDGELQKLRNLIDTNVEQLNRMIKDKGIEMVMVKSDPKKM